MSHSDRTHAPARNRAPRWVGVFVSCCLAQAGAAADQAVVGEAQGVSWMIAPYALAANISGEVGIGRVSGVPVDVDTGEILENLDMGGMLHAEVWYKSWGLLGEVVFMNLSGDYTATGPLGSNEIDAELSLCEAVYEGSVAHRIASGRLTMDVIGGVRVWDLSTEVDLSGPLNERNISADETWVDPLVGARARWSFAERWSLIGRGDIGGFGIGSEFAWNAAAYVGWDAAHWCTLLLGYRAVGVDYDNEEDGQGAFAYDTITFGTVFGAAFTF